MTFNDRVANIETVGLASSFTLQPASGINWLIKNIASDGSGELYFLNSGASTPIKIATWSGAKKFLDLQLHCSNGFHYAYSNTGGGSSHLHYDGIITNDSSVGDTLVQDIQTVTSGNILTIQPPAGQEWVIHNICGNPNFKIHIYDGTTPILIGTYQGNTLVTGLNLIITNSDYLVIENLSIASGLLGYDGIRTK